MEATASAKSAELMSGGPLQAMRREESTEPGSPSQHEAPAPVSLSLSTWRRRFHSVSRATEGAGQEQGQVKQRDLCIRCGQSPKWQYGCGKLQEEDCAERTYFVPRNPEWTASGTISSWREVAAAKFTSEQEQGK